MKEDKIRREMPEYEQPEYKQEVKREIANCLEKAGEELYASDKKLICDEYIKEYHVHERSICFRFGIYLNRLIASNELLKKYNLDAEYNKDKEDIKRLPAKKNGCCPDLILHKRGTNDNNILVIECKGWWSGEEEIEKDKKKISAFLHSKRYHYMLGLLIKFDKDKIVFDWIE